MGSDFGEEGRQRLCAKASVAQICADSSRADEDSEFRDRTDIFLQRGAAAMATRGTLTGVS